MPWIRFRLMAIFLSISVTALLTACSSTHDATSSPGPGGGPTPSDTASHFAVADTINHRVLLYPSPLTTNESASVVLGQADFNSSSYPTDGQATATSMTPMGMAMDAHGDLFVADRGSCRVLMFKPPLTTSMSPSVVIGQSTFTGKLSGQCGVVPDMSQLGAPSPAAPAGMDIPVALSIDGSGNLWVVDQGLSRVTEYVPPFTSGMAASVAIGQPTLEATFNCNNNDPPGGGSGPNIRATPTATDLCEPSGIAFDAKGNLWIADGFRVLEYLPPFKTGMAASLEIGQTTSNPFGDNPPCPTSASCIHPVSIAFDGNGNLWAVDIVANRILQFAAPFSNGMSASVVLGQSNFTSDTLHPPAANTIFANGPAGTPSGAISFDSAGNLLVADSGNSRVLIFTPPFSTNMNASMVIGQPDFTTTMGNPNSIAASCDSPTATTLCYAQGVLAF